MIEHETLYTAPHRRWNLLTGEWVTITPGRTLQQWNQEHTSLLSPPPSSYDPACPFCPGSERTDGTRNPNYTTTLVLEDDGALMLPDIKPGSANKAGLLVAKSERGICRLLSHAPRHDLTLAGMETRAIRRVIDAWAFQFDKLGSLPWVRHVRIFENRGTLGAANPHPHTYVWGQEQLTNRTASKLREQRAYMVASRGRLLKDYLELELDRDQRVVCHNRDFAAVVPFWSSWPFETMILPRIYCGALSDLSPTERDNLADILQQVTRRYDLLFGATLPYSMSLHQRPTDGRSYSEWQLHIHFYPPLPRATSISPLLAGYELPDQPLQVAPEEAARILRTLTEEMREVGV